MKLKNMKKIKIVLLLAVSSILIFGTLNSSVFAAPLLSESETGFNGQSRGNNYDSMMNALFSNNNVITEINGNLWVPWYKTSSSSKQSDLQSGSNCNSGQTIDYTHNCMVTDEFSQVGLLVAMGKEQKRMDQFYNTLSKIKSTNGNLPSWRVYRNGNSIEPCNNNINSNCDSASDANARIVTALFTASKNKYFSDQTHKSNYESLAKNIVNDMISFETEKTCRPTRYGTVCNWLAGGSEVKKAGIGANDFAYTGYYPDAIIAMLAAYSNTGDSKYLTVAKDYTANYLQAAKFDGKSFTAPPGKSFRWTIDSNGQPQAQCTNHCDPLVWDAFDASRALGMCQANYYAKEMGVQLHNLQQYCNLLGSKHMNDPTSAPIQFRPDGSSESKQSGYFAQGLQALHQSGVSASLFKSTTDNALSHYSVSTNTFDYSPSFGVYTQAFPVRALGMGIGRDEAAFKMNGATSISPTPTTTTEPQPTSTTQPTTSATNSISSLIASCSANGVSCNKKSDVTNGACRTVEWGTANGNIKVLGCEKSSGKIELYAQEKPSSINYQACLSNGCVSNQNGFASFTPTTSSTTSSTTTTTSVAPATTSIEPVPITSGTKKIGSVAVKCTANGVSCNKKSDVTNGACRTVEWGTANGNIKVLGCEKSSEYAEVYRQEAPSNFDFDACMDSACVNKYRGFDKFKL